jgi:undecaprenol kinase
MYKLKLIKLLKSFAFAFNGIKICFASETNFKIHIAIGLATILLGLGFGILYSEWIVICICIALVIAMEMINTAIEKLCDVVQTSFHPTIKKVKDIAAGAALIMAIASVIVGAIIFLPKIIIYLQSK